MARTPALSPAQVADLRRRRRAGAGLAALAARGGVGLSTVHLALAGRGPYARVRGSAPLREDGRTLPKRRALSDAEVARLRRARGTGAKLPALARAAGVSATTVLAAVYGRGGYARVRVPPALRSRRRRGRPAALTRRKREEVLRRRAAGESLREVARGMGVSTFVVRRALARRAPKGARGPIDTASSKD